MTPSVNPTIPQMHPITNKTLGYRGARGGGRSTHGSSGIDELRLVDQHTRTSNGISLSGAPGTLTVMTTSTDVLSVRSAAAGGLAALGIAGWLGTMSPHTARAYEGDLRQFIGWLAAQQIPPDRVTPGVVTGWLSQLEAAGQSVATRRRKLAAVLSFYRYAAAEGLALTPPVPHQTPRLHRDDADTGALDNHHARRLWKATAGQPRTRALVAVLLLCGLRINEALTLQVTDLDTQQGATVLRVTGKGAKPRTAVLPAPAVVAIRGWLEQRGDQPGPLFATRTGTAMDPRAAHRLIGRIGEAAGIARLHPHSLRHTFATSAVDAGADVLKIATALGHASPSTTMRYVRGRDVITGSPVHAVAAAIVNG